MKVLRIYLKTARWDEVVSATTFRFLRDTKPSAAIPQKAKYYAEGGDEWPDRTVAESVDWK